jgi:hypothetical protein
MPTAAQIRVKTEHDRTDRKYVTSVVHTILVTILVRGCTVHWAKNKCMSYLQHMVYFQPAQDKYFLFILEHRL